MDAAVGRMRFGNLDNLREAVAQTIYTAIEYADAGKFHTPHWWAEHLFRREWDRQKKDGRTVYLEDELKPNGSDDRADYRQWGHVKPRQEGIVLAKEMMALVAKLPTKLREVIALRLDGADVFAISRELAIRPDEVLSSLRDARLWLLRVETDGMLEWPHLDGREKANP